MNAATMTTTAQQPMEIDPEIDEWIKSWDNLDDYDDSEHAVYDPKHGQQLITFLLGNDRYVVNILNTSEIIDDFSIRLIPNTSGYIKGVINLRGDIIPVMDLRICLSIPEQQTNIDDVIIILSLYNKLVGIIVDHVSEVIFVPHHQIATLTGNMSVIDARFIEGVIDLDGEILMLLDLEALLQKDQLSSIYRGIEKGRGHTSSNR